MNKGSIIKQVEVVDYSYQGLGVVKVDNFSIFVPFVNPGETIDIEITDLKKNYGFGKAINYQLAEVPCPYYYKCGSCNLMHMPYGAQIGLKQKTLLNLMHKNMIHANLEYFCSTDDRFNYRNKVAMPIHHIDGQLKLGYYKRNSHSLIPIDNCMLANEQLNHLIKPLENILNKLGEHSYNYKTKRGNLRHIVLRGDQRGVAVMVTTKQGKIKNEDLLIDELSKYSIVKSIIINTQKSSSRNIIGPNNRIIYGQNSIELKLAGIDFDVKPNAFFQVNQEMTNNILMHIKQTIQFDNKKVLDAFCGTGTIGQALASSAHSIVGIEIDQEAVLSAKHNAEKNQMNNVQYICDDIENAINAFNRGAFDVALVDPPRSGLAANMKSAIIRMHPREIIYVSCDPSTLMRDLGELITHYEVKSIKGFDMFPNTNHIETVAHLVLREEM